MTQPPAVWLRHETAQGLVVAPGAYDALTATFAAQAGFRCLYLSGAVVSTVALGQPDLGYVESADILAHAARMLDATGLPLVVDGDTGYGNALNARLAVHRFERAGIAGVHIEDQVAPKRCGAIRGKSVIEREEMAGKVRAAVEAREELVVIARTDAYALEGLDGVLRRAERYAQAGADLVFPAGITDPAELQQVRDVTGDAGLVANCSEAVTVERWPSLDDLAGCGVRLAIFPVHTLVAVAEAAKGSYQRIAERGTAAVGAVGEWDRINAGLGLGEALELQQRYASNG